MLQILHILPLFIVGIINEKINNHKVFIITIILLHSLILNIIFYIIKQRNVY